VTPLPLSWTKEFILLIAWAIALLLCGTVVARRLGR
jgi:hypothetical protein